MGGTVRIGVDRNGEDFTVQHVAPPAAEVDKPVVADRDLVIDRPDLGAGMVTQVRQGDVIPAGLHKFSRRAVLGARLSRGKTSRSSTAAKRGTRKR